MYLFEKVLIVFFKFYHNLKACHAGTIIEGNKAIGAKSLYPAFYAYFLPGRGSTKEFFYGSASHNEKITGRKVASCYLYCQVIGGKVKEGKIIVGEKVKIIRRENEIGKGTIRELQQQKEKVSEINEGNECGMMIESRTEIAEGDVIQAFQIVNK